MAGRVSSSKDEEQPEKKSKENVIRILLANSFIFITLLKETDVMFAIANAVTEKPEPAFRGK